MTRDAISSRELSELLENEFDVMITRDAHTLRAYVGKRLDGRHAPPWYSVVHVPLPSDEPPFYSAYIDEAHDVHALPRAATLAEVAAVITADHRARETRRGVAAASAVVE